MTDNLPDRLKTISEYHKHMGLPKPEHPLISIVKFEDIKRRPDNGRHSLINNFYSIALKKTFNAKMLYGQREYDFQEGVLAFLAPNQVMTVVTEVNKEWDHSGWLLLVHPDFLWNTPLASKIKQYEYFGYSLNEALHLSDKEETLLIGIMQNIDSEYRSNIDKFSQNVIIAQLEVLLTYSERFYERQFLTRKISDNSILMRLEKLLEEAFISDVLEQNGIPTVQLIASKLNLSPNYLSSMLKVLVGQSTKQLIHEKLISKAKEKLSTTEMSISEIAYLLGFEHPPSFSKLFKAKTKLSPTEFRHSFN